MESIQENKQPNPLAEEEKQFLKMSAEERLVYNMTTEQKVEYGKQKLRIRREKECFSVVNRGEIWYDGIENTQKTELKNWYIAWLDVTDTMVIPEKPSWLE